MAYPDIDALTNPLATDPRVGHAQLHTDINEALRYGIRKATVTLSSADILALNTTPITLVAAPGAGKYLGIHKVLVHLTGSTTAYTLVDSVGVRLTGSTPFLSLATLLSGDTGNRTYQFSTLEPSGGTSAFENTAVDLYAIDGDPTLGDGGLVITVWYSIEDVPA